MKRLIEFPLEDGSKILVEAEEEETEGGVVRAAQRGNFAIEQAQISFEVALNNIKPAAENIITKFRNLKNPPDEVEVEFGIKLSAVTGAIVAWAGGEANYKVTLTWRTNL